MAIDPIIQRSTIPILLSSRKKPFWISSVSPYFSSSGLMPEKLLPAITCRFGLCLLLFSFLCSSPAVNAAVNFLLPVGPAAPPSKVTVNLCLTFTPLCLVSALWFPIPCSLFFNKTSDFRVSPTIFF